MLHPEIFRTRYYQLKTTRPSVVAAGFWFMFLSFFARLCFFLLLLALIGVFTWALQLYSEEGMSPAQKKIYHSSHLQTITACCCIAGMIVSGFARRMSKRVVARNVYIAELELLVEEGLQPEVVRGN